MRGRAARAPRPDRSRLRPARATPTERWLSGRKHRTRNAAYGQPYRGFESHPLRHNRVFDFITFFHAPILRLKCATLSRLGDCRDAFELHQIRESAHISLAPIPTVPFEEVGATEGARVSIS